MRVMPIDEWDSYPGYDDEDSDDTDCLGPDEPDDWISEADEVTPK